MQSIPRRRWLERFTNTAGNVEVVFSRLEHEWTPSQPLDVPLMPVTGADYAVNLLGNGRMPKRVATERVRYLLRHSSAATIDEQVDAHRARLRQIGTGRLWAIDDDDNRRWARAQVLAMPDFSFGPRNREFVPVSIEFARLSDWYAEDETVSATIVSTSPRAITVTNDGSASVTNAVLVLDSGGTDGFINPRIDNLTTGEWLQVNRTGSTTNHLIRIDTGRFTVERSTDGGTTWTDDYAALETSATQAGMLTFAPGINDLQYSQASGTPNVSVDIRFHAPFE